MHDFVYLKNVTCICRGIYKIDLIANWIHQSQMTRRRFHKMEYIYRSYVSFNILNVSWKWSHSNRSLDLSSIILISEYINAIKYVIFICTIIYCDRKKRCIFTSLLPSYINTFMLGCKTKNRAIIQNRFK